MRAKAQRADQAGAVRSPTDAELNDLEEIQARVLWLSTLMVHHANKVRANPDGAKVGGHQASSASMVGIMTSIFLRLHALRRQDLDQAACVPRPSRDPLFARKP
jgi:pyruvate dehydrogenase complex dehydrogenase (E1) component